MRIMLVDDDPFSIEKLKARMLQLSEQLGTVFEIVSECYSGQSALEQMPLTNPDTVFTDIQMSAVNGIELAKAIQVRWPSVHVVVISAYPMFEYAREAMKANVVEYLLKPVDTAALREVLLKLLDMNRNHSYNRSRELLHGILSGALEGAFENGAVQAIFPFAGYRMLLIQNVEALYDVRLLMPKSDFDFEPMRRELGERMEKRERSWFLPSDDRKSLLLIFGLLDLNPDRFRQLLEATQQCCARDGVLPTIVYSNPFEQLEDIRSLHKRLYVALSERIVIGKPRIVALEAEFKEPAAQFSATDEKRFVLLLQKRDVPGLKRSISGLFDNWEQQDCTSMIAEINLKRIVHLFEQQYRTSSVSQYKTLETRIEELVDTCRTFGELKEAFFTMLDSAFQFAGEGSGDGDARQLFDKIEMYIASNIGQPLSLQTLTDQFHVSRTVICNLFRDYSHKSYVEYLTALRMKIAQDLMRDYPKMLNKEIAEIVGYTDQNYFSHVFKTVTEMSPTRYRESLTRSGG
ncbi:response regulator transcription factor [Cohnella hashimotonis]|uniref:Response regulator n=1 Tax=Cohnella hashimotonis TaxID=2826895 RepID=A0ABT6TM64_9BACL|nr:response regulator [Cohnella hashimotonis]MDI4647363.1 response regulator [Cohnella hashimotonis]